MTFAEFLLARIAEDETAAQRQHVEDPYYRDEYGDWLTVPDKCRILAECEVKRRIFELHKSGEAWCDHCSGWYGPDPAAYCPTLRLLALPYMNHPDYGQAMIEVETS